MAQRLVKFNEGSYYHIYNRGARWEEIFLSDDNYDFVMRKASYYSHTLQVPVVASSLMPNHYHFLLHQQGAQPAGLLAQRVFNSYTKAFNKMYGRTGTLFESPFKSKLVDKDEYLTYLCAYIHLNPVSAGLVEDAGKWPHSNYLECIGLRNWYACDRVFISNFFGSPKNYREFVQNCASDTKLREKVGGGFLE